MLRRVVVIAVAAVIAVLVAVVAMIWFIPPVHQMYANAFSSLFSAGPAAQ